MSDDFNIDNEGSGFALEAGQDLNSLLSAAKGGEAAEDNIATDWLFEEGGQPPVEEREPTPEPVPTPSFEESSSEETAEDSTDFEVNEPTYEPTAVQEAVPETYSEEPVQIEARPEESVVEEENTPFVAVATAPEREEYKKPQVNIPSAKDELARVKQVVRVLNAYRDLNGDEQETVSQFVTNGEIIKDEAQFIVAVLNADHMLGKAMTALKEAKDLEAVDRAFYVIELSENLIYYLGNLIAVFTEEEIDRRQPRGQYAKALVRSVEKLDAKSMNYVHATASVLEAVNEPKN